MTEHSLTASKLCEICRSIDITKYFQRPQEGEANPRSNSGELLYKSKELGTRKEIRIRSARCTFCKLVYAIPSLLRDDASITIRSTFCGRNKTTTGAELDPAYWMQVHADLGLRNQFSHIQVLAEDAEDLGLSRDFRARGIEMGGFNMRQARTWLDICCSKHGDSCTKLDRGSERASPAPQPKDLLAIDLVKMCICNMPSGSEYIALSYCWPSKAYLTTVKQNKKELFERGALIARIGDLPGTVQDAIECAKELPYRYLWIDALCIVQDDMESKITQLRQMDLVYSCAGLTLVCAYPVAYKSGDPCSGFPGYRKADPARSRNIQDVDGLRLMVTSPDVEQCLSDTRWDTRCWTYQEGLLSRRLLYITPTQVYFQCSQSLFCEDIDCENISTNAHIQPRNTLWNTKARNLDASAQSNWGT